MRANVFLLLMIFTISLYSQEISGTRSFSQFWFGTNGGINFNSIDAVGGTAQLEVKANLTSKLRLKLSAGYSSIFDNGQYEVKTYSRNKIQGNTTFSKYSYSVEKIEYAVIPINIGLEYEFTGKRFSPFTIIEFGYNANSAEEQKTKESYSGSFNSIDQLPDEYQSTKPKLNESSFVDFGIGFGIRRNITASFAINLQYVFRYNNGIPNTNQILIGFVF